ncbi:sulfotransferase [Ideonella sp. 4Y11]|uniref:Sulfotransferase n=1 Tax=Ideonella aquatica TaxID=2824119 RepID=A0A940YN73_9BURK|nr:sulfotransferase [Ideonella aquatica]MBQ0960979.1 sulfotransferase [Ideonella aquatica]
MPAAAPPSPPDPWARAMQRLAAQRPPATPLLRQAAELLQTGRDALVEPLLAPHLARRPDDADALYLLARAQLRTGRPAQAIAALRRCVAAQPDFSAARYNLAKLLDQQGWPAEAEPEARRLLAAEPDHPLFAELMAHLHLALGEHAAALAIYQRLADAHPSRALSWLDLGHALRALGRRDDCVAAYRRACTLRPGLGGAWWALADLRNHVFEPAELATMQQQLARPELPVPERAALQYALAKAREDAGDAEGAFTLYAQGAAALRARIDYDPDTLSRGVARQCAVFTPAFFAERASYGCLDEAPVFIVSRPRSGSTLVEQILASHPQVEATAELPYIGAIAAELAGRKDTALGTAWLDALVALPPERLRGLGERYLALLQRHRHLGRPVVLDKKPANFFHLGLIRLILPKARIVEVRRTPVASALSIFKSFSSKGRLGLAELGRYHRDYLALMDHFQAVLPGAITRLHYEDLVADPEGQTRRLLAALNLPFDDACLRFHENPRGVTTPSSEQVRRPIHAGAVEHWRAFEPWLGPLIDALGPAA